MAAASATESAWGADNPPAGTPAETRPRPGRWVAVPAGIGVTAHLWLLASHQHGVLLTTLLAAMTLWCAWCTVETWQEPSSRRLTVLMVMALAMVAVHTAMVAAASAVTGGHVHHGTGAPASSAVPPGTPDETAAMVTIIAVELGVAFACALALRQQRSRPHRGHPHRRP